MPRFLSGLALVLFAGSACAVNDGNQLYFYDAGGHAKRVNTAVGSVAIDRVDFAGDPASSAHVGAAFAPTQTLRALTALASMQPADTPANAWEMATAKTTVTFSKTVFIDPGVTGLAVGTLVPLAMELRFDGAMIAGSRAVDAFTQRVVTSVDLSADYSVVDLDDLVCGEGCRPREVANFGHSGNLMYDYNFGGKGTVDVQTRGGWNAFGAVSGYIEGPYRNDYDDGLSYRQDGRWDVDTGTLRLEFTAPVGHTLRSSAYLDIFVQALGVGAFGRSVGAFASTFDADLTSPVAGLLFVGETQGVMQAVPEPASVALLLAGLLAVGAAVRCSAAPGHGRPD